MKKKYAINALIIMSLLFIIGLFIICNATNIAQSISVIDADGMDIQQYYSLIKYTIGNYRIAGLVTSIVGGVGILLSGYKLYKEF